MFLRPIFMCCFHGLNVWANRHDRNYAPVRHTPLMQRDNSSVMRAGVCYLIRRQPPAPPPPLEAISAWGRYSHGQQQRLKSLVKVRVNRQLDELRTSPAREYGPDPPRIPRSAVLQFLPVAVGALSSDHHALWRKQRTSSCQEWCLLGCYTVWLL
jgi:hypothetical protein